jgi:tetratricopeptide (TPR) repeat protein
VLFNFAMTHAEGGEFEEALDWVNQCLDASHPDESHVPKALAYQVNCLYQLKRFDEALSASQEARSHYPNDIELLFREAILLHSIGRPTDAIERYRGILGQKPENTFRSADPGIQGFKCRFNLGLVYQDLNRLDEAELQFRLVLAETPGYKPASRALANVLLAMDRLATAELESELMLECESTHESGSLLQARVWEQRGDWDKAAEAFAQCHERYPESTTVLDECYRFHFMREQWESSIEYLTSLIKLEPDNPASLHNMGSALLQSGRRKKAVKFLKKSLKLRPDSPATNELLTTALADQHVTHDR